MSTQSTPRLIPLTLIIISILYPSLFQAGEQLTLRELSTRSVAIASVHIDLKHIGSLILDLLNGERRWGKSSQIYRYG